LIRSRAVQIAGDLGAVKLLKRKTLTGGLISGEGSRECDGCHEASELEGTLGVTARTASPSNSQGAALASSNRVQSRSALPVFTGTNHMRELLSFLIALAVPIGICVRSAA
jgi:hypothetical protein